MTTKVLSIGAIAVILFAAMVYWSGNLTNENLHLGSTSQRRANVDMVLLLTAMTTCRSDYGVQGGVSRPGFDPIDFRSWLDNLADYNQKRDAILWSYKFLPHDVIRNGRKIKVLGEAKEGDSEMYFSIVPAQTFKHITSVEFVELKN